jgi:hypothetical protein
MTDDKRDGDNRSAGPENAPARLLRLVLETMAKSDGVYDMTKAIADAQKWAGQCSGPEISEAVDSVFGPEHMFLSPPSATHGNVISQPAAQYLKSFLRPKRSA